MIEDRQPRRGFRDNAAEYQQVDDGVPERAWPTAGHRPPGYGEQGTPDGYAYEQSGEDESPRRAAHSDGDRDDADDLQYGPPSDRYSVLAELAYDPDERDRGAQDHAAPPAGHEQEPYQERFEEPQQEDFGHPYREAQQEDFGHPYGERFEQPQQERFEEPQPHGERFDEAYREGFDEPGRFEAPYQQGFEEPVEQRPNFGEPTGPFADGPDTDAPYRRDFGQDDQPTAIYGNPYEDQHAEQGGVPWGPPPLPISPAPAEIAAPTDVIDLTAPRVLPRTHRGEQRKRALVLAVAAAGVLVAGGTGFAIFGTGSSSPEVPAGAAPADESSTEDPQFPDESDAPTEAAAPPAPSTPASASATVTPSATATTRNQSNPRPTTAKPTSTVTIKLPPRPTKPPTKPTTKPPAKPPTTSPTTTSPTTTPTPTPTATSSNEP